VQECCLQLLFPCERCSTHIYKVCYKLCKCWRAQTLTMNTVVPIFSSKHTRI
jgi:hypothetical protein